VLVDEAYADFAPHNCIGLLKEHKNIIILRSLSKGYSLAGIRFGYGIADAALIEGLMKLKDSYNVDALSIEIATAAISDQQYFKKNVELVIAQRKRLTEELRKIGFIVEDSSANFIFAQIKNPPACEVFEKLKEKNIFVRYFPIEGIDDKLRITVGTEKENGKLIEALKKIVMA